jgi:hypothetical protein
MLLEIGLSLGSTVIGTIAGAIAGYLGSRHFAKKSEQQLEGVAESIAHNLRVAAWLTNFQVGKTVELFWEEESGRILKCRAQRSDEPLPINHYFKPLDWSDEKMEAWKQENRQLERKIDEDRCIT